MFTWLAVPFFILAGDLMETGGIALRLINLANALVGHLRGGLGMVVIVEDLLLRHLRQHRRQRCCHGLDP